MSSDSPSPPPRHRLMRSTRAALGMLIVRFRSLLLLAGVLLLVGSWPTVRGWWDRWTSRPGGASGAVSSDTEYWCPMCPGVLSDWPGKCPVCNMTLVRRQKGETVPLPDGVVARMQLSPYRMQLAGIRTALVGYRPLLREVVLVGPVVRTDSSSALVEAEVFEKDLPFLTEGRAVKASSDLLPGHLPFAGSILTVEAATGPASRSFLVRLKIEDPERHLPRGSLVTARLEGSVMRLGWWRRSALVEWRDRTTVELAARSLLTPALPGMPGGIESLLRGGIEEALSQSGHGLAVPCSAVIDHGSRKVAFVESGPGMFDAVEVTVGPRCGDYYPVLRGLLAGQNVAVAGAFLLDAEMWLNHGAAAAYFGASRGAGAPKTSATPEPGSLSAEDRLLIARQKICPVTGALLDSMGGPVRVDLPGRTVFVCCDGCSGPLRKNPEKYLAKLPK